MNAKPTLFTNVVCMLAFVWMKARSLMSMPFTLAVRTHTRNAPTIMPAAPSRLSTSRTARLPHP